MLTRASSEAWRYHGTFTRWNRFRAAFPGLGIATVAFAGYCTYEYFFMSDPHHGEAQAKEHH
jgi:NADH dehydrogenase (ubiquinone) 1 beta subcomplex subunit 3